MRAAILVAALSCLCVAPPAQGTNIPEAELGPWIGLGLGAATIDALELTGGAQGTFVEDSGAVGSLALDLFYTTLRLDYGLTVRHLTGGSYQRPNGLGGKFGSLFQAGPLLRWRYWSVDPGSFYVQYVPAWTVALHSPYVRRDAAVMHGVDPEDLPTATHGHSSNLSAGLLWMLSPSIAIDISVNAMVFEADMELSAEADGDACEQGSCIEYQRFRSGLRVSFCWTL